MNKGSWGKIRAFFDLQTEDGFTLKGFKLVEGINGLFVGFPSQKGSDDEYYDTVWVTEEVRESIRENLNKMAVEEYEKFLTKGKTAKKETADFLRMHGGKTGEELKAEGK